MTIFHRFRVTKLVRGIAALSALHGAATAFCQGVFPFHERPPAGLNAGDRYRIVFVTDSVRTATSDDINDYNRFAQREAEESSILSGLNLEWRVIGTTYQINAKDNTGTNPVDNGAGVPIYLVDGSTRVADGNADMWDGALQAGINLTQQGRLPPGFQGSQWVSLGDEGEPLVWTGTNPGGENDLRLGIEPEPFFAVTYGSGEYADSRWIERHGTPAAELELPIYSLSSEMVAVPEPAGLLGFGFGILAMGAMVRRRCGGTGCDPER